LQRQLLLALIVLNCTLLGQMPLLVPAFKSELLLPEREIERTEQRPCFVIGLS
jgi:hypothetical protein